MYPIVRLAKDVWRASRQPRLENPTDTNITHHICWPQDLDFMMELNNGRMLSLYDLGRFALATRIGLIGVVRQQKWGLSMAGHNIRYRRNIRPFERFEMRSRVVCWDDRFTYMEQSMWKGSGECASHMVSRVALTQGGKLIAPNNIPKAMGRDQTSPPMPGWVAQWVKTEVKRPWPPMQETQ